MTPKEKAQELIDKYDSILTYKSKQCALIAVEELIYETGNKFWYDVKQEINKL